MKVNRLLMLSLSFALFTGCRQSAMTGAASSGSSSSSSDDLPTAAQPKLPTIKLWVGPQQMIAEMALTERQQETGMMFRTNMGENEGMIFVNDHPKQVAFWMKNCPMPLSCAYMDVDGRIVEIHDMHAQDTNSIYSASDNIEFVLETPEGWFDRHNIKPGTVVASEKGPLKSTFLNQ